MTSTAKTGITWILAALMSATALACDCNKKPEPKVALQRAAIVFSGRVVMGRVVKRKLDNQSPEREMREYLFEVSDIWKGPVPRRVFILTGNGGGDCGFSFEIGEDYLVYASGDGTQFGTNICSRTNFLGRAEGDLNQLGASTKPK